MDIFKRNNGPSRSRQGSLDASYFDDKSNSSWAPPANPAASMSQPDLPSPPDRRMRDQTNLRRSSVFTLRSRSNTANSMSAKAPNLDDHDRAAHRSSRDLSAAHAASASISEPPPSKPKPSSMFAAARGRKLRRQSSKLTSTTAIDDVEEVANGRRGSVFGKDRKRSTAVESVEQYNLRMRHISNPFDFQHLTHTNSQHLQQALESSQNELVAEFWAHRASQVPNKELRGIKVEDLNSNAPFEAVSSDARPESDSSMFRSSLVSPKTRDLYQSPSPKSDPQAVRHTRSTGSFSQPIPPSSPRSPKSRDPHVPTAPPRMSSRLGSARGEDTPIAQVLAGNGTSKRSSGIWNNSFHRPSVSNEFVNDLPFIPHAVTTPDDTAMHAASPTWNATDLEHIAEEEEGYFGRKSHDQSVLYSPSPEMSPTQKPDAGSDLPLRSDQMGPHEHLKSFANHRPTRPRPLSQMSDTLGAPFCPPSSGGKKTPGAMGAIQRSAGIRRRSTFFRSLEETNTWEDDIDYCYDIGADADCDFEWDRMSTEAKERYTPNSATFANRTSTVVEEDEEHEQGAGCTTEEKLNSGFMPNSFRPSLVVPSKSSIPDLDYRSAVSTSTNSLLTPVDPYVSSNPKERSTTDYQLGDDSYTPSLLVPQDFKEQVSKEEMYDDLLNDYESDRHYPLVHARSENTLSIAESSRSGPSRYSMASSYESSLRSASISLSSPARGSRGSTGSVPELVHSRRAARRTMEIMVNRLSKEMTFEDDEEDTGSKRPQTFFADDQDGSDDEMEETKKPEPRPTARRGATAPAALLRSPVSSYHERSASDGAAKLLAKAGVKPQHARTTSTEQLPPRRGSKPTLSLFPQPPRAAKNT